METIIPFFLDHQAPLLQRICRRGDFFSLSWIILFPFSKLSPKESPFALAPPSFFPLLFFSFCFPPLSTSPLSFFFLSSSYPPFTDLLSLSYLDFLFFFWFAFFFLFFILHSPLFLASSLIKYHPLPLRHEEVGVWGTLCPPLFFIFYVFFFFLLTIFIFFHFFVLLFFIFLNHLLIKKTIK